MASPNGADNGMPLAVSRDCGHGHDVLVDYFRCPETFGVLGTAQKSSAEPGYFAFGEAVRLGVYAAMA